MSSYKAEEMATLRGAAQVRDNDIIDRARELLSCAIESADRAADRVNDAMNRIAGPIPPTEPAGASPIPTGQPTIAELFAGLERAQARLHRQLDRFREQAL